MTWPPQRLPAPEAAQLSRRQQIIYDEIASGPRGGVRGPLAVWLHRPELAERAQALGRYCRYDSSLSPLLSELAILVTARIFGSEYEWHAHKPHALNAGLSPEIVEAIRQGKKPEYTVATEEVVHEVATSVHVERDIGDALYARAHDVLGTERLVDLVGLLGYYTLISLTINVFRVPPQGNAEPELSND